MSTKKIPTAADFFNGNGMGFKTGELEERGIEFAKLHLEAALKQILDKAKIVKVGSSQEKVRGKYNGYDWVYLPVYDVDKQSILDAYPLDLIK